MIKFCRGDNETKFCVVRELSSPGVFLRMKEDILVQGDRGLVVLWNDRDMKIHEGEIFIFPYNIMNRRAKGSMYIQDS